MKDVKVTYSATDLQGNIVERSYNTYLSGKSLIAEVKKLAKSTINFTVVSVYTGEVLAQGGV